jgi:hypothetical protein
LANADVTAAAGSLLSLVVSIGNGQVLLSLGGLRTQQCQVDCSIRPATPEFADAMSKLNEITIRNEPE